MSVLVLTYHAIGSGPPPLFVDPGLLREQLDAVAASGARSLTISELADALRAGSVPEKAVALTFDDGAAAVASLVAPLLSERGLRATVYCVAGRLGGTSDWNRRRYARFALVAERDLVELAAAGIEIGSHGLDHVSLRKAAPAVARREIVESKERLEHVIGLPVRSFAYPYGAVGCEELVGTTYDAACTTDLARVSPASDPHALPRVDVHYLRSLARFERALAGRGGSYLRARRLGARARRLIPPDDPGQA